MPKAPLSLALTSAALLCGALAHAQDGEGRARPSRIAPDLGIAPPPPIPIARPREPVPEILPPPASNSDLVATAGKCLDLVSPDFEVRPEILFKNGWSFTKPRRQGSGPGSYEFVQYDKDDFTIALLDFGSVVLCRAGGLIAGEEQVASLRAALIETLRATPIENTPGMDGYISAIKRDAPETDLDNVLIAGDYMLEIMSQTRDTSGFAEGSPPFFTMVMVSSVPVPAQFRSSAQIATPD